MPNQGRNRSGKSGRLRLSAFVRSVRNNMSCPLCGSSAQTVFSIQHAPIVDCSACSHRFYKGTHCDNTVTQIFDDSYFTGGGAGYSDYTSEKEMLIERGRMYAKKLEGLTHPGRILDVGAACGFLLKGFVDSGWNGVGLEPNRAMTEMARSEVGMTVLPGTLEKAQFDERFDLISMIQVVGHLYDPAKAFTRAYELLNDDGLLLIETWDRSSISARIFGKRWHEYSPPSVVQWFSAKSLSEFLSHIGFERLTGGRPAKWISGGHAASLLRYKLGNKRIFDLIPEDLMMPYPAEDLFWAVYRKRN